MARMQTHQLERSTVLGPCPGCELWTIEYDGDVLASFDSFDTFETAVETLLADHLAECPGLQEIVYNTL